MNLGRLDGRMRPSPHGPHIDRRRGGFPLVISMGHPWGFGRDPWISLIESVFAGKLFEWVYDLQAIDVAGVLHVFGEE
jgi:hypothetical protein